MSDMKDYMISKNKAEEYEKKKTLVKKFDSRFVIS